MSAPANPDRADDTLVKFCVDPGVPRGNVLPALARLLIDLSRRKNGPAMAARFSDSIPNGEEDATCP